MNGREPAAEATKGIAMKFYHDFDVMYGDKERQRKMRNAMLVFLNKRVSKRKRRLEKEAAKKRMKRGW